MFDWKAFRRAATVVWIIPILIIAWIGLLLYLKFYFGDGFAVLAVIATLCPFVIAYPIVAGFDGGRNR